ncbi:hypothetical protein, partial [Escherichia coli]|uniref:hypothetical protein n=1 Tax=Escherichia coli TaxID=562 RepID=UPI0024DFF9D7
IVSVVTLVWGISPRQPSGKNIIRWLLKKRTNGSVRYCQYTSIFPQCGQFQRTFPLRDFFLLFCSFNQSGMTKPAP